MEHWLNMYKALILKRLIYFKYHSILSSLNTIYFIGFWDRVLLWAQTDLELSDSPASVSHMLGSQVCHSCSWMTDSLCNSRDVSHRFILWASWSWMSLIFRQHWHSPFSAVCIQIFYPNGQTTVVSSLKCGYLTSCSFDFSILLALTNKYYGLPIYTFESYKTFS